MRRKKCVGQVITMYIFKQEDPFEIYTKTYEARNSPATSNLHLDPSLRLIGLVALLFNYPLHHSQLHYLDLRLIGLVESL